MDSRRRTHATHLVGLALILGILAGCGSAGASAAAPAASVASAATPIDSQGVAPFVSPSTSAAPAQSAAPPTASPTPAPTPVPTPTPAPTVPTVGCTIAQDGSGTYAQDEKTVPPAGDAAIEGISAGDAAGIAAYYTGSRYLLAPRLWTCTGTLGANGSGVYAIVNRADRNSRIDSSFTVTYGEVLERLCTVLPKAKQLLTKEFGFPCPALGTGVRLTNGGSGTLGIVVKAGSPGEFWHGRSTYRVVGRASYDLGQGSASMQYLDVLVCAQPTTAQPTCSLILGTVPPQP